jgi:preprotein translocase subunit SecG
MRVALLLSAMTVILVLSFFVMFLLIDYFKTRYEHRHH